MSQGRHPAAWRLARVGAASVRVLAAATLALVLLAPVAQAAVTAGAAGQATRASSHRTPVTPARVAGADTGLHIVPPLPETPDGGHEIPVEGGRIKDWQAMLVAGGAATVLMFLAGKVRRK